jgi:hypothetical protein
MEEELLLILYDDVGRLVSCITVTSKVRCWCQQIMFSVKPPHLATSHQIEAFRRYERVLRSLPFLTRYS